MLERLKMRNNRQTVQLPSTLPEVYYPVENDASNNNPIIVPQENLDPNNFNKQVTYPGLQDHGPELSSPSSPSSSSSPIIEKDKAPRICGLPKRKFIWVAVAVGFVVTIAVVLGAALGTTLAKRRRAAAKNHFSGMGLLPGSGMSAVTWQNGTRRLFYQNGDGMIKMFSCSSSDNCDASPQFHKNISVSDALLGTSLAAVRGAAEPKKHIALYYSDQSNLVKGILLDANTGETVTEGADAAGLKSLNVTDAFNATSLAVVQWSTPNMYILFYQTASDQSIQRIMYNGSNNNQWVTGPQISTSLTQPMPGTKIVATGWDSTDGTQMNKRRVYYQLKGPGTLVEHVWQMRGTGPDVMSDAPNYAMQPNAGFTGFTVWTNETNAPVSQFVTITDNNLLSSFSYNNSTTGWGPSDSTTALKALIGVPAQVPVGSPSDPIAMAGWWDNKDGLQARVYYKSNSSDAIQQMWLDGKTWTQKGAVPT